MAKKKQKKIHEDLLHHSLEKICFTLQFCSTSLNRHMSTHCTCAKPNNITTVYLSTQGPMHCLTY